MIGGYAILQNKVDWWHCYSIIRNVTLETLYDICILHNEVYDILSIDRVFARAYFIYELYNTD